MISKQIALKKVLTSFLSLIAFVSWSQDKPTFEVDPKPSDKKWVPVEVLTDEFNQVDGIDLEKWDDIHQEWSGRPPSRYKKGNTTVSDGFLRLKSTLLKDPSTVNNKFRDIWVNAASCVSKKHSAKPGYYYEAMIKASSLSMTSSFWFRVGKFSEIDVIEHIGNPSRESRQDDLPYQFNTNTHYYGPYKDKDKYPPLKNVWTMPTRGRDGFNIYAVWWKSPKELIFYWNGKEVMTTVPRVPFDENLKMIFDTEVFPFAQAGIPSIGLPKVENLNNDEMNTMLVDWVRVWELKDIDEPVTSSKPVFIQNRGSSKIQRPKSDAEGAEIVQSPSTWVDSDWVKWVEESEDSDYFHLKNVKTNMYLRPETSDVLSKMIQTATKSNFTLWKKEDRTDGFIYLENKETGKYFRPIGDDDISDTTGDEYGLQQVNTDLRWHYTQWKFSENVDDLIPLSSNIPEFVVGSDAVLSLYLYPNPASNILSLKSGKSDLDVKLFSLGGELLKSLLLEADSTEQFIITDFSPGIYLVEYSSNKFYTKNIEKLIVK